MTFRGYLKRTEYDTDKNNKKDNFNFLNNKYCIPKQTVIAGDSITEIFNMDLFNSYIKESGKLVYNRGISGDTSNKLLERFDSNVLALKPSNLVLLIGTNDLSLISDVDYVFSNISEIVDKALNSDPDMNIILQSVYPVTYINRRKNRLISALNEKLRAMCSEKNITYLDVYPLLLDKKGGFNSEYTYDGLHPNVRGFEVVANQIIPLLK